MFDELRLKEALVHYKKDFVPTHWKNEKYKWEAVKYFQDNWDINAADFAGMLERSLSKTYNLLVSVNNFPAEMITSFAKTAPEEVRAMFMELFDESKEVYERINTFKMKSSILREKYGNGAGQHYQYENAITTYLWLRYPDTYYVYKFGEVQKAAEELGSNYQFKKGAYADNIRSFIIISKENVGAIHFPFLFPCLLRNYEYYGTTETPSGYFSPPKLSRYARLYQVFRAFVFFKCKPHNWHIFANISISQPCVVVKS